MKNTPTGYDLINREYNTVQAVAGHLVFAKNLKRAALGELVEIIPPEGARKRGQIIQISEKFSVIQVIGNTSGIDTRHTKIRINDEKALLPLSIEMLGRIYNGSGEPVDGLPHIIPEKYGDIAGLPINPISRSKPSDFIETGISAIDAMNTLVRGQKLPIFTGAGLPSNELAFQILKHATVKTGEPFAIVFGAIGITSREAFFFLENIKKAEAMDRTVIFLNRADDPTIERLFTPRLALTAAEFLAFEKNMHVLVILMDMTNYCDALREVSAAREEIAGRRGYPGYMYTDLATIFERAGKIKGCPGSITQLPIISMPDDDITHPIPDLTGYITEGQILLSRELYGKGIYPPIDVMPSLSRLMNLGIGKDKTMDYHREAADQLYALYAKGKDARKLESIVGKDGLGQREIMFLNFADEFENSFINQGESRRSIEETFEKAWEMLSLIHEKELTRISKNHIVRYHRYKGD